MTKFMTFFLAVLTAFSFAACASEQPVSVPEPTPTVQTPISEETEATETIASTETPEFQPVTLVDDESCIFRITAVEEDPIWGYTLKAYLENKTDLDLMFSLNSVSVNGFMCDPFWAAEVAPGMKANEDIHFSSDDFKRNGITEVTDISFTLNVYDSNDWTSDRLVSEEFTIYPMGADAVVPFSRTPVEGETVLFDSEQCTMIVTGFDPDGTWGYTVNVYLENKTEDTLMFSADDVSVNGFMCDPFWAESVAPGKRSNTAISWMESDFADNGITQVESITLPVRVYDENNWNREDLVSEAFTLTP